MPSPELLPSKPAIPEAARPLTGKAAFRQEGKNIKKEFAGFLKDVKGSVLGFVRQFEKFRDIVTNNYNLGRYHLAAGNLKDALLRFKFVLWLDPRHIDAMYYLGVTYMASNKKAAAVEWFTKAIKARPDFEEARYLLCVASKKPIKGEETPKRMPLTLAVEYFDGIAGEYDMQQLEVLKYEGHIQLDNAIRSCLVPGRIDHVVLDLGVGTGFTGPGLRDLASHLTGVDISANMLNQAMLLQDSKGNKIYDALIKREAVDFLADSPDGGYDIILSAALFSYMGDLEALYAQAVRVLKPQGLFAFTADVMEGEDATGYQFDPKDARFHFSKAHLQELAARHNLKELRLKDYAVYADAPAWIAVYQKA